MTSMHKDEHKYKAKHNKLGKLILIIYYSTFVSELVAIVVVCKIF